MIKLSKRLAAVAKLTQGWQYLADIGSDHAYLPIFLIQNGEIKQAIAGEVIPGPFAIANNHVQEQGLSNVIQVRLADGLDVILATDKCEVAVIAGMGGMLITEILDRRPDVYQHLSGLVLQPNQNIDLVRRWLMNHHWQITMESIVIDEGHAYQMMRAEPTNIQVNYTQQEQLMGPLLLKNQTKDFSVYWHFQLKQKLHLLKNLQHAQKTPVTKINQLESEITYIRRGLK